MPLAGETLRSRRTTGAPTSRFFAPHRDRSRLVHRFLTNLRAVGQGMLEDNVHRQVSASGLAVFRIVWGLIQIAEVVALLRFRELMFDEVPFVVAGDWTTTALLWVWLGALVLLTLGAWTRGSAAVTWICCVVVLHPIPDFEYHMDTLWRGIDLLLVLLPVGRVLSFDAARARSRGKPLPSLVPVICYRVPVFAGIAIVYLDSIFHKGSSWMWREGLGVWLPSSLPQIAWTDQSWLLDVRGLAILAGYLAMLLEASFVLLMWFPRARLGLFLVGVGMHVGIGLVFPIPLFALGVIALYLLLLPPEWFDRALARIGARPPTPIVDRHAYRLQRRLVFVLALWSVAQLVPLARSPVATSIANRIGAGGVRARFVELTDPLARRLAGWTGIQQHDVFLDAHFEGANHIVALVHVATDGNETQVPLNDAHGRPAWMALSRRWTFWLGRAVTNDIEHDRLADGVERITAFWLGDRDDGFDDATFSIRARWVDVPRHWHEHHLQSQVEDVQWTEVGTARWRDGVFSITLQDVEHVVGPQ